MSERLFQHKKQQEHCPRCDAVLQLKQGKKGCFWAVRRIQHVIILSHFHFNQKVKSLKS